MAQLVRRTPRAVVPLAIAGALLLAAVAAAVALSDDQPSDWARRGGWLLAQALAGFGAACALAIGAWWLGARRARE